MIAPKERMIERAENERRLLAQPQPLRGGRPGRYEAEGRLLRARAIASPKVPSAAHRILAIGLEWVDHFGGE
jgi:hypothetical protein